MSNPPYDNLLNRNQFILGTSFVEKFENWNKIKIDNSIFITAHPNLKVHHTTYRRYFQAGVKIAGGKSTSASKGAVTPFFGNSSGVMA